jgi:protein SCO1/2
MNMQSRTIRASLVVALAVLLAACGDRNKEPASGGGGVVRSSASRFTSTDITGAPWGRDFRLTDHNGVPRQLADFKGKVVVLYFGYVHCPDMCPTTLADMAAVVKKLGNDGDQVQGLFITIDPKRDTPKVLAQFVPAFNPHFLGLYADETTTEALAGDFKIFYHAQTADIKGNYTVDHSGGLFIFDPKGRLRLFVGGPRDVAAIAADVRTLQKE